MKTQNSFSVHPEESKGGKSNISYHLLMLCNRNDSSAIFVFSKIKCAFWKAFVCSFLPYSMNNRWDFWTTATTKTDGSCLAAVLVLKPFIKQQCHLLDRKKQAWHNFFLFIGQVFIYVCCRRCGLLGKKKKKKMKKSPHCQEFSQANER